MRSSPHMRSARDYPAGRERAQMLWALVLAMLALLLGLADIAHAQQPAERAAQTQQRTATEVESRARTGSFALDAEPQAFWQALGDTTLVRLIVAALDANRDVVAAEARIAAARATRVHTALDLGPAITASAGYSRQQLSSATVPGAGTSLPDQELWDAGVRLNWELDVFGRTRRSLQGRNALVDAAEEDVRDVGVTIAAEVARAYFDLRGLEDRLDVARRNAENQQSSLGLTRDRLDAGSGTALDTERAQAQLSSTLAEIPALEASIAAVQHRIAVLLGRSPGEAAVPPGGPTRLELPAQLALADPEEAVRRRPDVQSAASRVAARRAFVSAAKADYLPRIAIGGVAGYTASQFDALGNSGTPRYTVGPVISWPLLDIGRVKTGVDQARAGENEAAAQHQQTVLRALEEVETSLAAYAKARERLQHLEDAAAASERATDLARLRFREGGADFLEVLDAESRQLAAQDRLAAGRTEATTWLVAVYRAVGGMMLPGR